MRLTITILVIGIALAQVAAAQEQQIRLGLKEAIRQAIEKNLDLKAELYNPAIGEAEVRKNRGIYNPRLTLETSYSDSKTLPANLVASGGALVNDQQVTSFIPGVSQLFSWGGTLGVNIVNNYTRSNAISRFYRDDFWDTELAATFSQPLLKNFGKDPTELGISVAIGQKDAALSRYRTQLLGLVSRVRVEYYRLYSLREIFEARKISLDLARRILSETQARVKAGVLPAMEILNAEFGVAAREKDVIDAERVVRDQEDILRLLIQLHEPGIIVPFDAPDISPFVPDVTEGTRNALQFRPEVEELKTIIRTGEVTARVAQSRTLPDLNLTTSLSYTGLARNYDRSIDKVFTGNYPVWSIGLVFSYPLGNDAAENDAISQRLKVEQGRTQLRSLEEGISNEVRSAVRGVASSYKQLDVAERGVAFADERFKSYVKRTEVGLATTKDLLDVENDLRAARSNKSIAQVEYTNAVTTYWKSTGQLLDREGITFNAKDLDHLYKGSQHP